MLFDPKWEKKTDRTFGKVSLLALIAWLETKPAAEEYRYANPMKCVLGQFLQSQGHQGMDCVVELGVGIRPRDKCYWLNQIAQPQPQTFGAALERARHYRKRLIKESYKGDDMGKPILCLDFDGVIHSYSSGWKGADVIPDPIVDGAIAFMLGALEHFDVVIFSSRSNQPGGVSAMQAYLRENAGQCWYPTPDGPGLEDVRFPTEKPAAMISIDDRALTFTGQWPAIDTLLNFKPWNKGGVTGFDWAALQRLRRASP